MEPVTPSWEIDPNAYQPPVPLEQIAPVAEWVCPECAGPWMWNFNFRHKALCGEYQNDSATRYADYQRLKWSRKFTRKMTMVEWLYTLAIAPDWLPNFAPEDHPLTIVASSDKGWHRTVAGFNPDEIAKLLAEKA